MEVKKLYLQVKEYLKRRFGPMTMEEIVDKHGFSSCFSLFPANYHRKYSPEKLKKMREKELARLRELLDEYEKRITEDSEHK